MALTLAQIEDKSLKPAPEYSGNPDRFTDRLLLWLGEAGTILVDGSGTSVWQHGVRTAALALDESAPDNEVVAGLFHDVGSILLQASGPDGAAAMDRCGEIVGASWLSRYFRPGVSEPVRLQQMARRWLFAMDKGYRDGLSDEAFRVLASLGGPMAEQERRQFERHEHWGASVALARRSDLSTDGTLSARNLDPLRPAILNCLAPQMNAQVA